MLERPLLHDTARNAILVVVLLSLAVAAVVGFRAWQDAHEDVEPVSPEELLASFEEARARGELDEEEYARVRERLGRPTAPNPPVRPSGPG